MKNSVTSFLAVVLLVLFVPFDLKAYSKSESEAIADAAAKGANRGGIYISGGALLIILILVILL